MQHMIFKTSNYSPQKFATDLSLYEFDKVTGITIFHYIVSDEFERESLQNISLDRNSAKLLIETLADNIFAKNHDKLLANPNNIQINDTVKVKISKKKAEIGKQGVVRVIKNMNYNDQDGKGNFKPKVMFSLDDEKIDAVVNGKVYKNYKNVMWVWKHNLQLVEKSSLDQKWWSNYYANIYNLLAEMYKDYRLKDHIDTMASIMDDPDLYKPLSNGYMDQFNLVPKSVYKVDVEELAKNLMENVFELNIA
jgi:hypothetical protein